MNIGKNQNKFLYTDFAKLLVANYPIKFLLQELRIYKNKKEKNL